MHAQYAKGVLLVAVHVAWACTGCSCFVGHSHWRRCRDPCDRWWPGRCGGGGCAGSWRAAGCTGGPHPYGGGCFVGPGSIIVSKAGISIGEDVLVAERVTIRDQDHAIHGDLSLPISRAGFVSAPIIIGDGAWIAAGAVILKGVTIGKGAVVAANAVVNRDVADFEIVGGVPAQRIGMRGNNGNN